jgi:anti-sigma regulatory factor (Ser/Thr protein kinase)
LSVAPDPAASGVVRAAVADWAAGNVSRQVIEDVQLLVSELVTNSMRHAGLGAGDVVRVAASLHNGSLRLEVENPGVAGDVATRAPGLDGGGGFGLQLVAALAERWGVVRDSHTCVWAEIASHPAV